MSEGEDRKREGMGAVGRTHGQWLAKVIAALKKWLPVCALAEVTGEDLTAAGLKLVGPPVRDNGDEGDHNHIWGCVPGILTRAGFIVDLDKTRPMKHRMGNARKTPVYKNAAVQEEDL